MIIRRNGAQAEQIFNDNGITVNGQGDQNFKDGATCVAGEISSATNDGTQFCYVVVPCAESRWHVRCNIVASIADPRGGTWATCTPHYDQEQGTGPCWHAVPAVFGNRWPGLRPDLSGFDAGRDWFYYQLVTVGGHSFLGVENWGNIRRMHQCSEEMSGSNGWVNHIQ